MTTPRWYMVNKMGMATLCTDKEGAEQEAADAQRFWPHMGPHRAVQLVEAADVEAMRAGYAAARLEIESLRARIKTMVEEHADELAVAHLDGRMRAAQPAGAQRPGVATWTPLPGTLPEPGKPVLLDIGMEYPIRAMWAAKHTLEVGMDDDSGFGEYDETTDTYYCPEGWYEWNEHEDVHWRVDKTPTAWCELPQNGGAPHGQAPAPAQAAHQQEAPAVHSGWVSCTIEFDGSGPEEVAYGPKIMMDRLAKWLGKHFERTIAEKAAPQPLPASQGDALDAARLDWLLLHISGAEFRRIGVHYSGNARRADVDAARAAQEDK